MKKIIFMFCVIILIFYIIHKILEYKGIKVSNNMVYIIFYIFIMITIFILPSSD